MHEMSIAEQLLVQAISAANANGASSILSLDVECGQMQQVDFEAMEFAFSALCQGTIADGAELHLSAASIEAVCGVCGLRYSAKIDMFACPQCRSADAKIVSGKDIVLRSMECEVKDGVTAE